MSQEPEQNNNENKDDAPDDEEQQRLIETQKEEQKQRNIKAEKRRLKRSFGCCPRGFSLVYITIGFVCLVMG